MVGSFIHMFSNDVNFGAYVGIDDYEPYLDFPLANNWGSVAIDIVDLNTFFIGVVPAD
jgi:hypothetical protein